MLDTVLDAVTELITSGDINAVRDFPAEPLEVRQAVVCVGLKSGRLSPSGWGDYLGNGENGREVYGARAELVVGLDIFAPAAGDCPEIFENVSRCFDEAPSGLRVKALICGETGYDEATEMFLCRCEAHCDAIMTRAVDEETGEFTDFVLRGVLTR